MAITIRVQAIKPKALDVKKVQREIEQALIEEGKVLKREFNRTTESWKGVRPKFDYRIHLSKKEASVHCFPTGDGTTKWRRIDEGTQGGYPITPKGGRVAYGRKKTLLIYQSQFTPKTRPGQLQSRAGGKSGPYDRRSTGVIHPGVEPREFSKTLGEQEKGPFAERIQKAVDRGLG